MQIPLWIDGHLMKRKAFLGTLFPVNIAWIIIHLIHSASSGLADSRQVNNASRGTRHEDAIIYAQSDNSILG